MEQETYIPGTCNIGRAEVKRRRNSAILSAILFLIVIVLLLLFPHANKLWRLTVFLPAVYFGICFQQWYLKFCVLFGILGIFNFRELGKAAKVKDGEMLKADKAKAIKMIVLSVLFGIVVAVGFYLVP